MPRPASEPVDPPRLDEPPLFGWIRRSPAWLALAAVLVVLWVVAIGMYRASESVPLAECDATVFLPDGMTFEMRVRPPFSFTDRGIPTDARVHAICALEHRTGGEPLALWVDRPRYAVEARWDGQRVGRVGDPFGEGAANRAITSLFAPLPAGGGPGPHVLELDIRGDFGQGGILGRTVVGPAAAVHLESMASEAQRLALALGAAMLAALPSIAATRGARRPASILFALFAAAYGGSTLLQTNLYAGAFPAVLPTLRLFRAASIWTGAFGVWYVTAFTGQRARSPEWAVGGLAATVSASAFLLPARYLHAVETAMYGAVVLCLVLVVVRVLEGYRRRVPGASLLAAGCLAALLVVPAEIAVSRGYVAATLLSTPFGILSLVSFGGALLLRDARASERHERLMRGSPDAMITVDQGGAVRYANPAAEREVLARLPGGRRDLLDFVVERDHATVRRHLESTRLDADRVEFTSVHGRIYESLATPIDRQLRMLTLRDITQRRELDRAMYQAARVEIAGTLLGGVAHDFNNTLQLVLAYVENLRARIDDPWAADQFRRMESAVDRASGLTKRMLTVARGSGTELGSVRVDQVVYNAIELLEPKWPKQIVVSAAIPPDLPPILGNGADLGQVLLNLLVNARDALGEVGRVRVLARPFTVSDDARGLALLVEDDGPGIPDARKEEVFQPFVTTKSRGTGLGLAVARQILRDHQGRMWVEDRPGGGARFLLAMWLADVADEGSAELPVGRKVVVVEDETVLLEDYVSALRAAGYEVTPFSSSAQAARHLEAERPDLLITDLTMPDVSGIGLATLCGSLYPDMPVLLVSAFIPPEAVRGLRVEWHPLHKPARAKLLVSTVGRILRRWERRQAGSDEITRIRQVLPDLSSLTARGLGFDAEDAPERVLLPRSAR